MLLLLYKSEIYSKGQMETSLSRLNSFEKFIDNYTNSYFITHN